LNIATDSSRSEDVILAVATPEPETEDSNNDSHTPPTTTMIWASPYT
jgi:hypothetical protein